MAKKTKGNVKKNLQLENRKFKVHNYTVFAYVLLMFGLFPLLFDQGYSNITETKHMWFWVFGIVMLGVLLLGDAGFLVDGYRSGVKLRDRIKSLSVTKWFAIAFLLVGIISTIASPYIELLNAKGESSVLFGSMRGEGLLTFAMYLVIFWVISKNGRFSKWLMVALGVSTTVMSVLMFCQYFGGDPLSLYPEGMNAGNLASFYSTLGNIDMIGGFICLSVAPLFCYFVTSEEKWSYALLAPIALGTLMLLLSNVDSGNVGLALGLLLLLPFLANTRAKVSRLFTGLAAVLLAFIVKLPTAVSWEDGVCISSFTWNGTATAVAVALAVCLAIAALFYLLVAKKGSGEPKRLTTVILTCVVALVLVAGILGVYFVGLDTGSGVVYEASSMLHGNLHDEFGSYRGIVWKNALPMGLSFREVRIVDTATGATQAIMANPIIGTGPDTFYYAFQEYAGEEVQAVLNNVVYDHAHNEFLQTLCNYGIAGLLCYLGLIATIIWRAMKYIRKNPLIVVCMAGVVCYLIHSFFSFSITIITPLFWIFMGMLEREITLSKNGGMLPFEPEWGEKRA